MADTAQKKCYCESGQKKQDIIDSEERYELWYYRDDVGAFIYRTIVMSIGWLIYMIGAKWFMEGNPERLERFLWIFQFPPTVIIPVVLAIVQNIIVRGKGESFRKFIKNGIPIVLSIAIIIYTHIL